MAGVSRTSDVCWYTYQSAGERAGYGARGPQTGGLAGDLIEETVDEVRAAREKFRGRGAYGALVLERYRVGGHLGATLALTKANIATSGSILSVRVSAPSAPSGGTFWRSTADATTPDIVLLSSAKWHKRQHSSFPKPTSR